MKILTVPLPCGSDAYLEVYLREKEYEFINHSQRPCILVIPGGAYGMVAPREGEPVALEFSRAGYQACVLYYSVRNTSDKPYLGDLPLREAAAAMHLIRENAAVWGIDPHRVSAIGSSAGGHLTASLAVFGSDETRLPGSADGMCKPDAVILCYPVIYYDEQHHSASVFNLTGRHGACPENDAWNLDRHVTPDTCPAFIWHSVVDDCVPVQHALTMAQALQDAGVKYELHLYTMGRHGIGLANGEVGSPVKALQTWLPMALQWLEDLGLGTGY